jgi:stage V sporulation protein D (sporulation-specific penicillin-binding protein)
MMKLAERIGVHTFCTYFSALGLDSKTGIDLPGEADSIYTSEENMSGVDLAVYSFGQRYNVTAIQQITAVAAVANGGTLVTPHMVKEITDDSGNVLAAFGTTTVRQIVSKETSDDINRILEEGVSGNGGAKNVYVKGYKIAAKTGTSEKGTQGARIGSTVAYAPADDPEIICILIVDEPTVGSLYGSTVAAPYVADIMADVLPYLGFEPEYTGAEQENPDVSLPNLRGMSLDEAILRLMGLGLRYEVVGNGTSVVEQVPPAKSTVSADSGKIILYTTESTPPQKGTVPNVLGMTAEQANAALANAGFNVRMTGSTGSGAVAIEQSIPAGTETDKGTVITVKFRHMNGEFASQ